MMNKRCQYTLIPGLFFAFIFPVFAQEMDHSTMDRSSMDHSTIDPSTIDNSTMDHNKMEVQQHGTTMMHTSPSDENDMSHTVHDSAVSEAMKKDATQTPGGHHADHDMGSMEHDPESHAHHEKTGSNNILPTPVKLEKLKQLPPSGKSREANFDGTYYMHNTSHDQSLNTRCALASRGLIMLDNQSWSKCGGKPVGWPTGIASEQQGNDHKQHRDH